MDIRCPFLFAKATKTLTINHRTFAQVAELVDAHP